MFSAATAAASVPLSVSLPPAALLTVTLPCDCVVLAVGSVGNTFDTADIRVPVYAVGDCAGERTADIASAIRSAYHTANQI